MGTLNKRLDRLTVALRDDEENSTKVAIVYDDGTIDHCSQRKEGCPTPCNGANCWWEKRYPNARKINLEPESEE